MSQELEPLALAPNNPAPPSPPLIRKKFLAVTLFSALICFSFFKFWFMPVKILGESMYPTYRNGTRHFLNRMAYWSKDPQRGDVVGMRAPDGDLYIKRIVGLPGDIVEIRDGTLIVNDQRLDDPRQAPLQRIYGPSRLGKDEYFIIGDNRFISVYGPIARESILGKIVL